ncbi:carboxypeptidase regulatory-like domain-containing protein, partial [Candidatus Woesearchaeota archaeon]|nr:carboxypeptidase regulatory-like domain-containing protein [Candidatus Woesearchaeota archaeon]
VYNGNCNNHKQIVDIDGDGYPERCVAQSPGEWIEDVEIYCSNGLDDDFDLLTDCEDPDCGGTISGTIRNENNQPISLADVSLKIDITTVQSAITDISGTYSISIGCGTYNLIAAHSDYAPQTKSDISLGGGQQLTVDFNMVLGTSCEDDCTFAADNIVHASCDGRSGCNFYDDIAKQVCDLSQPGWVRDYNTNNYIVCAEGTPQPKANIQASVTCSSGTLVKMTRIVVYKGKPVKLVVATCG